MRIIVQGPGSVKRVDGHLARPSRGWGVFTGSLLDADLERPRADGDSSGSGGHDAFGELFPAFFLEGLDPTGIGVPRYCGGRAPAALACPHGRADPDLDPVADGSPSCPVSERRKGGCPAQVRVEGNGAAFLTETDFLAVNGLNLDPAKLAFSVEYALDPRAAWVRVTSRVEVSDPRDSAHAFPIAQFPIPVGAVLLFGAHNAVFSPGAGFDLLFSLQDAARQTLAAPAIPALTPDLLATAARDGEGVSYGYASLPSPQNFVFRHRDQYATSLGRAPTTASLLVPFFASGLTGAFTDELPSSLAPGQRFTSTGLFFIGHGDVGSVRDAYYEAMQTNTGRVIGEIRESVSDAPLANLSVVVDRVGTGPFAQYFTDAHGVFTGTLEPGDYTLRVVDDARRPTSTPVSFSIAVGRTTRVSDPGAHILSVARSARFNAEVRDARGVLVPARVTLVGHTDPSRAGDSFRSFLFDLKRGERWLPTESVTASASETGYQERYLLATDGRVSAEVRPGVYTAYASRGPAWSLARIENVSLRSGALTTLRFTLIHELARPGWIGADLHVHSGQSLDSGISLRDRVASYAAEGVDYLVSTDHNFLTDLAPSIEAAGLSDFLATSVGLELTTLEMGHFNGFPLAYAPGAITHGSFDWVRATPDAIFDGLRNLGRSPSDVVVQVNHPRDSIIGYFNAFNVDGDRGVSRPATGLVKPTGEAWGCPDPAHVSLSCSNAAFSTRFDAMEILTGKRTDLLRTFRVPAGAVLPPGVPSDLPSGAIVRVPCPTANPHCNYAKQDVAFPGAVEDWFHLLNNGVPITGTGNSDSHGMVLDEAGTPRNWVQVPEGHDTARTLDAREVSAALRAHRNVVTTGPMLDLHVDGAGIGALVKATGNQVHLTGEVRAASWMRVDTLTLVQNGVDIATIAVPEPKTGPQTFAFERDVAISKDAWMLVIATDSKARNLWPVLTPMVVPPLTVSDAVKAVAGNIGLDGDALGSLRPNALGAMTALAITNPIWIEADGDGVSFGRGAEGLETISQPLTGTTDARSARGSDLRRLLRNWTEDAH